MKHVEVGYGEMTLGELINMARMYNAKVIFDGDRKVAVVEVEE